MTQYCKRLIEVDLPIKKISEHARRDQNVKKGHLHYVHVWWATRPLASCRAVIMGALLPDPVDSKCPDKFRQRAKSILSRFTGKDLSDNKNLREVLLTFIADYSAWDNAVNHVFIESARELVLAAHPDGSPIVLDPFAGAGSIPFEALRVGAQSFAGDLNPIPVLINKVSLEYLPKFGIQLAEKVDKWGKWLLNQAKKDLEKFYPSDLPALAGQAGKGEIPIAYIWARTVICEGPGCGAQLPLLGLLWLSKKSNNLKAFRYWGDTKNKQVVVEIFSPESEKDLQSPISRRFAATCPICGYTTPYKRVREQVRAKNGGTQDARLLAVITLKPDGTRDFRLPNENDLNAVSEAEKELRRFKKSSNDFPVIPDEPYPDGRFCTIRPGLWNIKTYGDLFNFRQSLALITFCELVRELHKKVMDENNDRVLADAVVTCLALAVSNMSQYLSSISIWVKDGMISAFAQGSGVAMRPDFAEANPLMPKLVGGFEYALTNVVNFIRRECGGISGTGTTQQGSATAISLPDDSVPYIVTDPPYYDAIRYADLSDFCYVWLKRMLKDTYPDLTKDRLTPKDDEIVVYDAKPNNRQHKDNKYFEDKMKDALAECRRVLMPGGVEVVIFAHKGTAGWEALLNALVSAGWTVTASWPIDTERAARMMAKDRAVLASSVHLVCRPRSENAGIGDWREVLLKLQPRIHEWMPRLSQEGIVGADAIFSCLGPALEIFSRYERVETASGKKVELKEYLEHVWAAVAREALNMIFAGADASGFEEDSRLTALWLWTLHSSVNNISAKVSNKDLTEEDIDEEKVSKKTLKGFFLEYDAARKIAQGLGAHLEVLGGPGSIVEIKGDKARLVSVGERWKALFGKEKEMRPSRKKKDAQATLFEMPEEEKEEEVLPSTGKTVLDRLHQAMLLFADGRGGALRRFIVDEGAGNDDRFWRLAQSLSALYPAHTDEKRWIDGVLARKKSFGF